MQPGDQETLERDPPRRRGAGMVAAAVVGLLTGAGATAWWSGDREEEGPAPVAVPRPATYDSC